MPSWMVKLFNWICSKREKSQDLINLRSFLLDLREDVPGIVLAVPSQHAVVQSRNFLDSCHDVAPKGIWVELHLNDLAVHAVSVTIKLDINLLLVNAVEEPIFAEVENSPESPTVDFDVKSVMHHRILEIVSKPTGSQFRKLIGSPSNDTKWEVQHCNNPNSLHS